MYQADWYHPGWPQWRRKLMWNLRNPLQNFRAYVIGVQDRNYKLAVVHGNPDPLVVQRNDVNEAGFQVTKPILESGLQLPFASYSGKHVVWYAGFAQERFRPERLSYDLAVATLAFALTTDLAILVQLTLVTGASPSLTSFVAWAEFALCLALPFFFSGVVVSLALTRSPYPIGKVYGADLIGAAIGCIGALVLLNMTSGPSAVLWVGAVIGLAALGFTNSDLGNLHESASFGAKLFRYRRSILTGCLLFAVANALTIHGVRPTIVKDQLEAPADLAYDRWNSFSRITVGQSHTGPPAMWGPSPSLPG